MDRRDARLALTLARQWAGEGLLPAASLATLERRHAGEARDDPDAESFGSGVLYALGGILLGAAVFALWALLQEDNRIGGRAADAVAPPLFLAWGLLCAAGALLVDRVARKPRLGDALHVAALLAITTSGFPRADDTPYGVVGLAFAAAVLAYRRRAFLVPFFAVVAFNGALAGLVLNNLLWSSNDTGLTAWFLFAVLQAVALVLASRRTPWPWPTVSLAGATLLLAGTFLAFYFDVADEALPRFDASAEVYLAVLMGGALAAGLGLREKGLVLAAALAIAIDSIVFAFDVGRLLGGLVAILAVAGLLLWQAGALRRYLRES